jgi:mono/diheme cytochrome c family protein
MHRIASILIFAFAISVGAPAIAANLDRGAHLASIWCSSCHIINAAGSGHAEDGVPSLPSISRGGMSPGALRAFLSHPHGGMPDLSLTRAEINDLVALVILLGSPFDELGADRRVERPVEVVERLQLAELGRLDATL